MPEHVPEVGMIIVSSHDGCSRIGWQGCHSPWSHERAAGTPANELTVGGAT
jgi:hypothetical protein